MLNIKSKSVKFFAGAVMALAFAFVAVSANAAYMFPNQIDTKQERMDVQTVLNMVLTPSPMLSVDGVLGAKSVGAIKAFQASKGLSADGKVGPITRAALEAAQGTTTTTTTTTTTSGTAGCTSGAMYSSTTGMPCTTTSTAGCTPGAMYSSSTGAPCSTTTTTTTTTMSGTTGDIASISQLSQYSSEEVGSGQNDVKVMGFDVEASNDGDVKITSIKLTFDNTGNASGDSDRLSDYLDTVTVWMGSTKVGSADTDDFNKDSSVTYSRTIQLDNAIVKADKKASFYVAVDAVNNLDSGDIDSDSMTVGINSIRFMDGSGVTTTISNSDSLLDGNMDYDIANDGVGISFVSYSSAADTELKFSTDNTPSSATVEVDSSENTEDVVMLKGQIEVEGDSDIWLDELPFTFTTTGESPTALASVATLTIDGKTFTETVTTTAASSVTVTFNDLDLDLVAGKTVKFSVSADMNDIEDTGVVGTDFDEGDTMTVSLTTTNRASVVAENEAGDSLTDSTEMTGSVTGNEMTFRTEGVNVVMGTPTYGKTTDTNGVVTQLTYTIPVAVTAFGDTLYMGQSGQFASTATASNSFAVVFENSSTPTTADVTSSATIAISTSNALVESNGYALPEGTTRNFTIEVTLNTPGLLGAVSAGNYRARIDELRVFTGAGLESAATATNNSLLPTTSYRTDFKYITS